MYWAYAIRQVHSPLLRIVEFNVLLLQTRIQKREQTKNIHDFEKVHVFSCRPSQYRSLAPYRPFFTILNVHNFIFL